MSNEDFGGYDYVPVREDVSTQIAMVPVGSDPTPALANAEAALQAAGWTVTVEQGGTHPFVIPLVLEHRPPLPGAEPQNGQAVPEQPDVLQLIPGVPALLDPMLIGTVAYKGNALTRGDFGRIPVSVTLPVPPRHPAAGRRTVVAILDTAVADHPWWQTDPQDDRFLVNARNRGWDPGPRLLEPAKDDSPGLRELAAQEGHGTFTAGLVRQIAPDAQVLAVHAIDDNGDVQGDHVLNALEWVRGQLSENDVVCLPFGFRPMLPDDQRYLAMLATVLGRLSHAGIHVVAAAGNDGDDKPVYPAAFAKKPPDTPEDHPFWIRSVGATNIDIKDAPRAYYSNGGSWVTDLTVGTSVVSTFPVVNAAATPEFDLVGTGGPRQAADPDDFRGGFARWSGTSFSAVIHGARIAAGTDPRIP
jgi:hypothetical protein